MSDITNALEKAIEDKQTVIVVFSEKPTGLYKPILGIMILGRYIVWSRRLK